MNTPALVRRLSVPLFAACVGSMAMASSALAAPPSTYQVVNAPAGAAPAPQAGAPVPGAAPASSATPLQVEQKLDALHYDVGPVDGVTDDQTHSAIMAFQKVYGLERTGELTPPVTTQLMATQATPPPLVPDGEANRVEVSLAQQVLFLYEGGALTKIVPVSSGTSETPTPTGSYRITRQESGWHTSALGRLYNAQYFVGGYALHGSTSVPAQPASHGCIRLPMTAAEWFPSHVAKGTQVFVLAT